MIDDADGRRVELVTRPNGMINPTTRTFRYQGDAIAQELTGTGTPTLVRTYVTDEAGTIVKVCDPACTGSNPAYLVTHNGHGDALALWRIEASGSLTLANSYTYSTWGAPATGTHNAYPDLGFRYLYVGASGVAWDNALGLGLLHMGARHYSPALGRFLQPDPSALETNLYAYGANSPISRVDPSGLWTYLDRRWMKPGWFGALMYGALFGAVCFFSPAGWIGTAGCGAMATGLTAGGEVERVRVDIFYERNRTLTVAIPFKMPYGRLVQGRGGLVTIYWTPKGAGRKCGEVLAGRRDPYQASLLCGDRVWMLRW